MPKRQVMRVLQEDQQVPLAGPRQASLREPDPTHDPLRSFYREREVPEMFVERSGERRIRVRPLQSVCKAGVLGNYVLDRPAPLRARKPSDAVEEER